ncbi:tetratricopeptide repeat protein [Frisingicoccus caecimuris]|uniref:Tetratricopeptide repeat protein n=1 Tax=Frisingicoccus caecimuris TaxID=1796636 RepID=A0A4R2LP01_9FIRM|nr:tetratricopeptide repeat protein [Frisingicoccus caecimuris]MCR1918085.1 tetratricopeptide repeat protein [Frisingicoccus caecimuris]TCO85500.1 tetratricopeptide repeat protein [Frisingicoccus caecimuris]
MNCPKCGTPLENTYRCPKCEYEEPTMKRIIRASNDHYNVGLSKAKLRDLSGAITSLQMSLKYNKRNTKARNLLGLVYFQMGETVSALSEWVISVHFQGKGNVARNYIKKVQNNQGQLQVINNTIQNYNLALKYLEEGNGDLAIIELKKVVNLNPNYIRAYQLLGLLYIQHKQYSAARKILSRALKLDRNNITTVRYMNELVGYSRQRRKGGDVEREKAAYVQIKDPNPIVIERTSGGYTDFNTSTLSFVNILIGIIIGAAVVGLLLVPSIQKTKASEYNQAVVGYSSQVSERNKEITSLQNQVDTLTDENDKLKNNMDSVGSGADSEQNDKRLIQAMKSYLDNDFVTAGTVLADVDKTLLDGQEAQDVYDFLLTNTKDTVINQLYEEACEYYDQKDYMNAVTYFRKVLNLNPDSVEAWYNMGRAYQYLTDFEQARNCYNTIINNYGDSDYANDARTYLSQIESRISEGE